MNKIFKVVWNKSKECYVVVSEFAKNNSGKKKIVVAGIFAALAMTNGNVVLAVNNVPGGAASSSVAFGTGADVSGTNSVGLGTNVKASKNNVVAIGTNAKVEVADGGVAIGQNASSKATYPDTPSVAVGKNSVANGDAAIAIGTSASVNSAGAANSQGIAIGGGVLPGQGATVIGDQGIAIGGNTKALGHSSIVIGGDDTDKMEGTRVVYTDVGTGKAKVGTISEAVKDLTGYVIKAKEYTNATADHIGITVGTKGQSGNAGIAIGTGADSRTRIAGSLNGVNTSGADNTSVTNAIAIGTGAKANHDNSVALGGGASATTENGVAIGSKSVASIAAGVAGYNANTGRTDTYANLAGATLTSTLGGVAVGTTNQTRQINYVAAGTADTDAVNVAQLKSVNIAFTGDTGSGDVNLANSKLAVNGDNTYIKTTANGKQITISGKKQDISVTNGTATGTAGMADAKNVAEAINKAIDQNKYTWNLSANGEATPEAIEKGNTVDFSGDNNITVARNNKNISVSLKKELTGLNSASFNNAAGNPTVKIDGDKGINAGDMKVTNVADGVNDTDAVNVSQLKNTQAGLREAINHVGVETQRVGAHAAAMAALKPIQYDPLEPTQIMAGIGNYRGETAGAIGLAHYKTEDTMFNIGVTLGSSHNMINAGVTHKFGGSRDRKDAIPERYKAGPISSIYVMQDEVSHLRSQNEEYKSKLEQQQSEIDALKAAVNQLLANKA